MLKSNQSHSATFGALVLLIITLAACNSGAAGVASSTATFAPSGPPIFTPLPDQGGSASPTSEGSNKPMQTYQDSQYGFEVSYPADYTITPAKISPQQHPQPARRMQFLSQQLARSATASLQPSEFAIEVYDNAHQQLLLDWLRSTGLLSASFTAQTYSLAGTDSLQVTNPQQLAPNQFYYLAHGNYIYRLIPLGVIGSQIMNTFKFTR